MSFFCWWPSAPAILLADGVRFLSMRARMPSQIFWSSASTFATYSFAYDACCSLSCFLCFVQFVPLCQQPQLQTELPREPWHPSLQSTWLLQRSAAVCYPLPVVPVSPPFQLGCYLLLNSNLRFNLNLVFSCFLGNLQFLSCSHALMTFSILVSRHWPNFSLRDFFLLTRLGLQFALLFLFF